MVLADDRTDFHALVLHRSDGSNVSLDGYRGRWMILHVGCATPASLPLGAIRAGPVAEVSVSTCTDARSTTGGEGCSCLIDSDGHFARGFPGLPLPSTFVVNPAGELVAIVSDSDYRYLAGLVVDSGRRRSGAVDVGDIVT